MAIVSMKALLESGVHFGHRTHKWHPAMKPYIFTERNSIHIIDLQKTVKSLEEAFDLVRDRVAEGGTVLFVGTKRQAQETILVEAERCGMPYVTHRWLGGMLTNWRTIRQRVNELERLERMRDKGDFERLPKKEVLMLTRKIDRLEMLFSGIRNMTGLPDLLFVVDVRREETSIHEANLLNIPVVAMVDTNCNPNVVDYVIPSNDDAIRAIKLLVGKIADAVLEGKGMRKEEEIEPMPVVMRTDMEEEELTDEDLLGEATLAKLASSAEAAVEEAEASEEEVADEGAVEEVEAESTEEPEATEDEQPSAEVAVEEAEASEEEVADEGAVEEVEAESTEEPEATEDEQPSAEAAVEEAEVSEEAAEEDAEAEDAEDQVIPEEEQPGDESEEPEAVNEEDTEAQDEE